jgi:hypothetical protein
LLFGTFSPPKTPRSLPRLASQPLERITQRDDGDAGGGVGAGVGEDEVWAVDHGAATVDDIGHIAFALVGGGAEEGFAQAADDARGVMEVEEDGAEAVFAHGADAVSDDEPTRVGFDRGAAVAELHEFPRVLGPDQHLGLMPKM